ncbi:MAG: restriction endonuclease subunit S [Deltaproteobacteria bacterium]|nr:restriction endonuclease subunit S [Deltaproteobacteria bacterium]
MRHESPLTPVPEWCERRLGEFCRTVGGGTPSRSQPKYWHDDIPWASVKDFKDDHVFLHDTEEHISQEGLESSASTLVAENTPIVCTRMAVGRCALTTRPTAINQDLKALLLQEDFDRRFFIRLLRHHGPELDRVSVGSTVRGITLSDLLSLSLRYPEQKAEQSRIAAVLDTVDEAIAKTEAVIAKLKQVRAGLLHDLLTRGLDEHGQLRDPIAHPEQFQDSPLGRIPREWRCSKFDDALNNIDAGKSPDYPDYPAPPGEWGVLKVSAIWPDRFRPHENKWVTKAIHQNPVHEVRDGDLLISRSNTYELVGLVSLVRDASPRLMLCDKTLRLRLKADRGLNPFFALLLQTYTARTQIEVNATGTSGSMKNISQDVIRTLVLAYPEVKEQQRILTALSPADQELEALRQELEKLSSLKSGLMTDLLTGRVRVPEDFGMRRHDAALSAPESGDTSPHSKDTSPHSKEEEL